METELKPLMSLAEVANLAGCSRATLYREMRRGRLRTRKLGSLTRIRREDFEDWRDGLCDPREATTRKSVRRRA